MGRYIKKCMQNCHSYAEIVQFGLILIQLKLFGEKMQWGGGQEDILGAVGGGK